MQLRRFRGRDMNLVMSQVTASLGADAMILRPSEVEPFAGYGCMGSGPGVHATDPAANLCS